MKIIMGKVEEESRYQEAEVDHQVIIRIEESIQDHQGQNHSQGRG